MLAAITTVIVAAIVVAALLVYFKGPTHGSVQAASHPPVVGKAQQGKTAPQFEVATTAGYFDLSKTRKPVFLEVFATWCPHCQRETAIIDRLYAKYRNRVDFVAVSGSDTAMDGTSASSELDVLNWIRQFNVKYPVAYDPLLNVADLYMQGGFPTIAIIGPNKKIRYLDDGEISYGDLDAALQSALRPSTALRMTKS
jgi:thiol-disulfide isomerase/thioredoxin